MSSQPRTVGSLGRIPVVAETIKPSKKLHWQRRAVQLGFIALLILIPVTGLFRIDPVDGAFVVLDRQIWFSDFFIVIGFWAAVASGLVLTYSMLGTAFCGWACPQNTLSEWANEKMRRLLGKRAQVALDGSKVKTSAGKNKPLNWLKLGAWFVAVSLFFALIPMFYFYPPEVVWSFVTLQQDDRLASSLHYIYGIFVLIILLNVAFIRHFFCRFMCIYKVWQHGFKTQETLHIAYDAERSDDCRKCNYCETVCFLDLDPKNTETYDACINCGECITACHNLHARKGERGLLKFEFGAREQDRPGFKTNLGSFVGRVGWTVPITLVGLALFVWGVVNYQPHHMAVYQAYSEQGTTAMQDYRINVVNKLYRPVEFKVSVEGLEPHQYRLSRSELSLATVGRGDINLHIQSTLPPGIHGVLVHVEADDGWRKSFRIQHFVEGERA